MMTTMMMTMLMMEMMMMMMMLMMMMMMMMGKMMTSRERTDKTRNLEEERIVKTTSPLRTKGNTKVKRGIQQIGNKKGVMEGKKEELKMTAQIGFLKEPNKEKI